MSRSRPTASAPPRVGPKSRFRFARDGRDVGPFTFEALQIEVEGLRCDADTLVFEERTQTWFRAGDIPSLAALARLAQEDRERVRLSEETDRAAAVVQTSHSRRWWLANLAIAAVLGVGGGAAWLLFGMSTGVPSGLSEGLLAPLDLAPLPAWSPEHRDLEFTLTLAAPTPAPAPRVNRVSTRRVGAGGAPAGPARVDTDRGAAAGKPVEVAFDFEEEVTGQPTRPGRPLDEGEVRRLSARIGQRVHSCVEAEVERTPAFRGVTIEFTLQPNGKAAGVSLADGGRVTRDFVTCVEQRVKGARVEPFHGPPRLVRVPLRISP